MRSTGLCDRKNLQFPSPRVRKQAGWGASASLLRQSILGEYIANGENYTVCPTLYAYTFI